MPSILVQHIRIGWTKDERGAAAGTRRNALRREWPASTPRAHPGGWLQYIVMEAEQDYAPQESWTPAPLHLQQDGVGITIRGDHAEVMLDPGAAHFYLQKPARPNLRGLIARLPLGQRLILRVNTAIDGHHQRRYYDHSLQIVVGDQPTLDAPIFREMDECVLLY
ncbi:hypothetical protein AB5I39_09795 [Sphingomonas sp. MMS24-J45]|uniref:hypothetical protein n=1 Tax=Sphingomonas sp. MMS24-J45 TaxID=3238806 RepID=UPI00385040F5